MNSGLAKGRLCLLCVSQPAFHSIVGCHETHPNHNMSISHLLLSLINTLKNCFVIKGGNGRRRELAFQLIWCVCPACLGGAGSVVPGVITQEGVSMGGRCAYPDL